MFLVEDQSYGATYLVFTWEDPRKAGYKGNVKEGVTLKYDMLAVHAWPDGEPAPEACVGQDPADPSQYEVFKYSRDLQAAGYRPVGGKAVLFGSWSDYLKLRLTPPRPDQIDDDSAYHYLDTVDAFGRDLRHQPDAAAEPAGAGRDEVASWVAHKHLLSDRGIREVWYLPATAPPEEIRLLEVNDRFVGNESRVEPVDFGLDIEGARFRLLVADITSDKLAELRRNPAALPPGWSLEGASVRQRRRP
jgi:hypothetical protein